MSYITHNKYEFNRPVCMKRKEKHTGLYIQSSPSFHIHFIGNHSIFRHDDFIGCFSADKIKKSVRK